MLKAAIIGCLAIFSSVSGFAVQFESGNIVSVSDYSIVRLEKSRKEHFKNCLGCWCQRTVNGYGVVLHHVFVEKEAKSPENIGDVFIPLGTEEWAESISNDLKTFLSKTDKDPMIRFSDFTYTLEPYPLAQFSKDKDDREMVRVGKFKYYAVKGNMTYNNIPVGADFEKFPKLFD